MPALKLRRRQSQPNQRNCPSGDHHVSAGAEMLKKLSSRAAVKGQLRVGRRSPKLSPTPARRERQRMIMAMMRDIVSYLNCTRGSTRATMMSERRLPKIIRNEASKSVPMMSE